MNAAAEPERVAERLRWLRDYYKCNNKEFAARISATETQFSNWVTGTQRMPLSHALILKELYSVPLDFTYLGEIGRLPSDLSNAWLSRERV